MIRYKTPVFVWFAVVLSALATRVAAAPLAADEPVRGWTILSDSEPDAIATIAAAHSYDINHLQLSHLIVHDLRETKDEKVRARVNRLTRAAHDAGIKEVVAWDHALYALDYYPKEFRTGPDGTIDLDNPAFWQWLKADYRTMLDALPDIDGIVLTFIETGARAERQYSKKLTTDRQKLAAVVNAVADVVVRERKLNLYARTFAYTHQEYANIIGAVALFENPGVRLMMKETPHDFFLTHPNDRYAGTIARPTLIEYDAAGEYHGQGVVANTWPEYVLRRFRDLSRRPHVIGYTARTDRYGDTRLVGTPGEINLYALKRGADDPHVTAEQVYDEFIERHYGKDAVPDVKAAFKLAYDIATCVFYTLGTNTTNHSAIGYEPYPSNYVRHVSGKWLDPPIVHVRHGAVDREFHYWRDVIDHLAPPSIKQDDELWDEVPDVRAAGWIRPGDRIDHEYLKYVLDEKQRGIDLAIIARAHIIDAQPHLSPEHFQQLSGYFNRTLLTARLHHAVAGAYFGFRVWARGEPHRTPEVLELTRASLRMIRLTADDIRTYPGRVPTGQWDWRKDADTADDYSRQIALDGWGTPRPATQPASTRSTTRPTTTRRTSTKPAATNPYTRLRFPYGEQ